MAIQDEELDYISTSPFLSAPVAVKSEDEADMPAIKRVMATLDEQIEYYRYTDSVTLDESILTVKEQIALNKMRVIDLIKLKTILTTVIADVREKYNG